jgi:hypothetical protein
MLRVIFWATIWLLTLGAMRISVEYADGLSIKFNGWAARRGD